MRISFLVAGLRTLTLSWVLATFGGVAAQAAVTGIVQRNAELPGVTVHYRIAGSGPMVVLLHGFAQTGHMWEPLMQRLATSHTVVAMDLRGAGGSSKPLDGYDKTSMARDVHALVRLLGADRVQIVGHDIGLMVAYAYAAQYPAEVERIVLIDAFLPGIGQTDGVFLLRDKWHFHFYGPTPLALVRGRERIYLEHFWNDFAADPRHSVSENDRKLYAKAYAQPGAMRAAFEHFRTFDQDAVDFAAFARTPLSMPMLVLTGERASGNFLIDQAHAVAKNVHGLVVPSAGHWLMEEAPATVIPAIVEFVDPR